MHASLWSSNNTIVMDRPVPLPCCLWVMRLSCHHCRWVGPGLSWWAIISPWSWWAVGPILSCLTRCLVIQVSHVSWVLWVSLSHWVAPLRGWLVSLDVMCFGGHHFLIIYNTVWIHPDLESLGIVQVNLRNPCILHLKAFVLMIAHFCSAILGDIIFLEYESGLWSIGHYHIWDSVTVSVLL